jgi:hypothetical protein
MYPVPAGQPNRSTTPDFESVATVNRPIFVLIFPNEEAARAMPKRLAENRIAEDGAPITITVLDDREVRFS